MGWGAVGAATISTEEQAAALCYDRPQLRHGGSSRSAESKALRLPSSRFAAGPSLR